MSIKEKGKLKVKDTSLRQSPKPASQVKKSPIDGRPIFNIGYEFDQSDQKTSKQKYVTPK